MSGLFNAIQAVFASKQWAFETVPDREVLRTSFEAHHTRVPIHVQAFDPIGGVHVVATSSFEFEPYHSLKLCELLMRVNQSLTIGNFELVWDTRQVLFRAGNLFPKQEPFSETILHALVHAAVAEMDRLTPLLAEIHSRDQTRLESLDIVALMQREDWLPPVDIDEDRHEV